MHLLLSEHTEHPVRHGSQMLVIGLAPEPEEHVV